MSTVTLKSNGRVVPRIFADSIRAALDEILIEERDDAGLILRGLLKKCRDDSYPLSFHSSTVLRASRLVDDNYRVPEDLKDFIIAMVSEKDDEETGRTSIVIETGYVLNEKPALP